MESVGSNRSNKHRAPPDVSGQQSKVVALGRPHFGLADLGLSCRPVFGLADLGLGKPLAEQPHHLGVLEAGVGALYGAVVLLDEQRERSGGARRGRGGRSPVCARSGRQHALEHAAAPTAHLPRHVQRLGVAAEAVAAAGAAVRVLAVDLVAVAASDGRQLWELALDAAGPAAPDGAVAAAVAGDHPGGGVAQLVHQRVPQPLGAVHHLLGELDAGRAAAVHTAALSAVAVAGRPQHPLVKLDLQVGRQLRTGGGGE